MNYAESEIETIKRAVEEFERAMDIRTQRTVRIGSRVTVILRTGLISIVLLAALMAGMIWAFTDRVNEMILVLGNMHDKFTGMAQNMERMQNTMALMELDLTVMPNVTAEVKSIRGDVAAMNADMAQMERFLSGMTGDVSVITTHIWSMDNSFRAVAPTVSSMGSQVDQASGPMRTMHSFFPFSP